MGFLRRGRPAPSAWWLVPVGVVAVLVGILLLGVDGGYQKERWEFLFLVGGPLLILAGVIGGLRGGRIEK